MSMSKRDGNEHRTVIRKKGHYTANAIEEGEDDERREGERREITRRKKRNRDESSRKMEKID